MSCLVISRLHRGRQKKTEGSQNTDKLGFTSNGSNDNPIFEAGLEAMIISANSLHAGFTHPKSNAYFKYAIRRLSDRIDKVNMMF